MDLAPDCEHLQFSYIRPTNCLITTRVRGTLRSMSSLAWTGEHPAYLHHRLDTLGFTTLALTFWALPGALGMFGLARVVSKTESILPDPVYALLSGLNAATVGLIALAGLQLSTRTITDGLSRTVLISACLRRVAVYRALVFSCPHDHRRFARPRMGPVDEEGSCAPT